MRMLDTRDFGLRHWKGPRGLSITPVLRWQAVKLRAEGKIFSRSGFSND